MWNLTKNDRDELNYEAKIDSQTKKRSWLPEGKEGGGV